MPRFGSLSPLSKYENYCKNKINAYYLKILDCNSDNCSKSINSFFLSDWRLECIYE